MCECVAQNSLLDLRCALVVAITAQHCITFLLPMALMELDMLQNRA